MKLKIKLINNSKFEWNFCLFHIGWRYLGVYQKGYPQILITILNIEFKFTFNNKNRNRNLFKGE